MAAKHSEEVKAAVMAALLAGQSISQVAKEYSLPVGTIKAWSSRARSEPVLVTEGRKALIGDLILDNLEAMLRAVTRIVNSVSENKDWLEKQSASELGVFIGVLQDKSIRIVESIPDDEPEEDDVSPVHSAGSAQL